ncbi:condensation domain-containing protein [Streptomyces broussonetiae]|uniref:condensation domain-containing protein n=1 Tax=Streptomyces broussonetiae TaxID=2686304 RepID=UPI0035DCCA8A
MDTRTASFAQRRLWFMDQLAGSSTGSMLPLVLRLRGRLDADRLERSLSGIVARHEVLRTRFTAVDGEPVPVVDDVGGFVLERAEVAPTPCSPGAWAVPWTCRHSTRSGRRWPV